MKEPMVIPPPGQREERLAGIEARGASLVLGEWGGDHVGEVAPLHVHYGDDEAWHVLSGTLRFRFSDREVLAGAGSTVFVPACVAHTFGNAGPGPVRYLIVTTARLNEMIAELHRVDPSQHRAVFRRYESELLE